MGTVHEPGLGLVDQRSEHCAGPNCEASRTTTISDLHCAPALTLEAINSCVTAVTEMSLRNRARVIRQSDYGAVRFTRAGAKKESPAETGPSRGSCRPAIAGGGHPHLRSSTATASVPD